MCLCVITQVMLVIVTKMACDELSALGYHVVVTQPIHTTCINVSLYKYYFSYKTCKPVDMSNAASAPPCCSNKDTVGFRHKLFQS